MQLVPTGSMKQEHVSNCGFVCNNPKYWKED